MTHAPFRHLAKVEERKAYDPYAQALTVIQEQHRILHDGFFYTTGGKVSGWLTASSEEFILETAAQNRPHVQALHLEFGRGDIDIEAFEGATYSAAGTPLTAINANRNSANTPNLSVSYAPTVTGDGTAILVDWAPPTGTGTGNTSSGLTSVGPGSEFILAPSTVYLLRLTNNSGATIDYSYNFSWYELDY